jgi:hypothetical protein
VDHNVAVFADGAIDAIDTTTAIFTLLSTMDDLCYNVTLRIIFTIESPMDQNCRHWCRYPDWIINGSPLPSLAFVDDSDSQTAISWFQ